MGRWGGRWAVILSIMVVPVAADAATATLPMGAEVPLLTATELSSKTSAKGDFVTLRTAADVLVDGHVVIAAGTEATAEVTDARAKGAFGMSGKLAIRPLYLRLGDTTVRLTGALADKGTIEPGAVVGMVLLTPGFTGRSAVIPMGTRILSYVDRPVELPVIDGSK
jgi:hypothetical protein